MKKILLILMALSTFNLQIVSAQEAAIKIASGNPDLKVQVKRCVANGDQVFIDLTFMDEAEDVEATILCQGWTEVQDSEGAGYDRCHPEEPHAEDRQKKPEKSLG